MSNNVKVGFVRHSSNRKVGPIPVVTSESKTCPSTCPLKNNGCFAEYGPMGMKWKAVDGQRQGRITTKTWDELCLTIKKLPRKQIWRHNDAGDLPGNNNAVDTTLLTKLVNANKGRKGFTYTHKPVGIPGQSIYNDAVKNHKVSSKQIRTNSRAVLAANANGFTINLSADNFEEADELYDLNIGPVVVVCPTDTPKQTKTPKGRHVIVCPAQHAEITCDRCGLCAKNRKAIVGFLAHGPGAGKINRRLNVIQN